MFLMIDGDKHKHKHNETARAVQAKSPLESCSRFPLVFAFAFSFRVQSADIVFSKGGSMFRFISMLCLDDIILNSTQFRVWSLEKGPA